MLAYGTNSACRLVVDCNTFMHQHRSWQVKACSCSMDSCPSKQFKLCGLIEQPHCCTCSIHQRWPTPLYMELVYTRSTACIYVSCQIFHALLLPSKSRTLSPQAIYIANMSIIIYL